MKTHFSNYSIPPVTAAQLESVGVNPSDLWFSPTFQTWVFCGKTCEHFQYHSTGSVLAQLGLVPNPEA
jgi:hypothetical protein